MSNNRVSLSFRKHSFFLCFFPLPPSRVKLCSLNNHKNLLTLLHCKEECTSVHIHLLPLPGGVLESLILLNPDPPAWPTKCKGRWYVSFLSRSFKSVNVLSLSFCTITRLAQMVETVTWVQREDDVEQNQRWRTEGKQSWLKAIGIWGPFVTAHISISWLMDLESLSFLSFSIKEKIGGEKTDLREESYLQVNLHLNSLELGLSHSPLPTLPIFFFIYHFSHFQIPPSLHKNFYFFTTGISNVFKCPDCKHFGLSLTTTPLHHGSMKARWDYYKCMSMAVFQ